MRREFLRHFLMFCHKTKWKYRNCSIFRRFLWSNTDILLIILCLKVDFFKHFEQLLKKHPLNYLSRKQIIKNKLILNKIFPSKHGFLKRKNFFIENFNKNQLNSIEFCKKRRVFLNPTARKIKGRNFKAVNVHQNSLFHFLK